MKRQYTNKVIDNMAREAVKQRGKGKYKSMIGWRLDVMSNVVLTVIYKYRDRKNQQWKAGEINQAL